MKVYKSYNPIKRDCKKDPQACLSGRQVKIKNELLVNSGFEIGKEFAVIYQPGKITLLLVAGLDNNN
jgi:hypothetical protein